MISNPELVSPPQIKYKTVSATPFSTHGKEYSVPTGLFIGNAFVPSTSGRMFESINPSNGHVLTKVYEADKEDVDKAVAAAKVAFETWKLVTPSQRGYFMYKLADIMEQNLNLLAELESLDNGKPLADSMNVDVPYSIACIRYYAGWADKIHGNTIDVGPEFQAYTRMEPYGVVGQIIPWNFPLLMLAWKWGPALSTGNTIVMKSSEKTPLTALKMCEFVLQAGFPAGVINVLSGFGPTAGNAIAMHMDIKKVAFTGSTSTGRKIMEAAAHSNLKKVSLELGGKSPNIVFPDADLDKAVEWASAGIFFNSGQVCCAGSRIFVHEDIYKDFISKFKAHASKINMGDALVEGTERGPLVDKIQFEKVLSLIQDGMNEGAVCELGGTRLGKEGYFVSPTLFTSVQDSMKIAREEIFGPVCVAMPFKTVEEVVERANNTYYGLAAAVHTKDIKLATQVSNALEAGTVWINCFNCFFAQVPFGGFKGSGIGSELGQDSLREYLQVKAVVSCLK